MKKQLTIMAVAASLGTAALAQPAVVPEQMPDFPVIRVSQQPPSAANTTTETPAEAPAEAEAEEESELEVKGYSSQSYSHNFNNPPGGLNQFRTYDFDHNKLKLDLLNINAQYAVDKKGEVGFRLDLTGGGSHPRVDAALGLFRDYNTGISTSVFDIRQAFLTYTSEGGIRVDVGKFATPIGFEVMDGVDGANPNATRSWAFLYGPFTHTGAKVSVPLSDQVTATALLVNGWDQFRDGNDRWSFGGQIMYKPCDEFNVAFNYIRGPERFQVNNSIRQLYDVTANWKVHEQIGLGFNMIMGTDDDFINPGVHGAWNGFNFYMINQLADNFNLNLRYEIFNDPVGTRTGVGQHLKGFTITPEYRISDSWMVRADLRFDKSDQFVFDKSNNRVSTGQNTFIFNNVVRF